MTDKARLYYEAHITAEPHAGTTFEKFTTLMGVRDWKTSRFEDDFVDNIEGMWFASAREEELDKIKSSVKGAVESLRDRGYHVLRWKIELAVLDSKYGDPFETLNHEAG